MKINKLYILILILIFGVTSCYEDRGNYDYKEVSEPNITEIGWSYYCKADETLEINPKIDFSIKDTKDSDFTYEWFMGKELVSTKKSLKIKIADIETKQPKYYSRLILTDKASGCKYIETFTVYIISTYNRGWTLLTENSEGSDVSFVSINKEENDETGEVIFHYNSFKDLYSQQNGEKISGNSIKLRQHFCGNWGDDASNILIVNSNGNIDLNGDSFVKYGNTNDYFFNGEVPDNFSPIDEYYLKYFSFIVDASGKTYVRKLSDIKLIQSGRYTANPLYIKNGLEISTFCFGLWSYSQHAIAYDKKNRRFVVFSNDDDYYDGIFNKVKIFNTEDIEDFSNFNDLQKDLVYMGFCDDAGWCSSHYFALLEEAGTYYCYKFKYHDYYDKISETEETVFPHADKINADTKYAKMRQQDYLAFSSNDKLYLYNTHDNNSLIEFYDFEGVKITSICDGMYGKEIGVGLENGKFYILNVTTKTIAGVDDKLVYEFDTQAGKIKDIIYKYENNSALESPSWY
jgi:hypothetical protein